SAVITEDLAAVCRNNGYRIGTGFLSTFQLLPSLCDNGQTDTAYKILENEQCPGWLYEVDKGATTIWENWLGIDENNIPRDSLNHYAMGSVAAWMYGYCAGIRPLKPGFQKIQIKPFPGGNLAWVKASYESVQGTILSEWDIKGEVFHVHVEVPKQIPCELVLPDGRTKEIRGSGDATCVLKR
ncbi:MAG TPA: alpha-L-rhamnosidase C-terminal domain-containing protein, partial [Clostridiales bacterium]|nr:alpha-L-rhamnosidase C-terminal domain-containing protein [Clostridiales bacterium]